MPGGAIKALTTDMGSDGLKPQIRRWISTNAKEHPPLYRRYMNVENTDEAYVEDYETGGFGEFPIKDEGDFLNFAKPATGNKTRYQPIMRQLAFAITFEDKKFNKVNKVNKMLRGLARSGRATIEKVAAQPFNLGFSTAFKGADGQPLFSTSHTNPNGDTIANRPGTDVDLTVATLEAAIGTFLTMIGSDGFPIPIQPKYLVVHPSNFMNANRIVGAPNYFTGGTPSAADTGVPNTIRRWDLEVVSNPYLTDSNAWFLLAAVGEHEIWVIFNQRPSDRMFDDEWTMDSIYSHFFALESGFSHYIGAYGTTGA